jgi:folylpolyglutamate synthase/dihydropteroate synthase
MDSLIRYLKERALPNPVLLFGATSGKPLDTLLRSLSGFARTAVLTCPPVRRGIEPEELEPVARSFFDSVESHRDPADALQAACSLAGASGSVLVTGSLYLVGEVLGLLSGTRRPGPVAM